MFLSPRFFCLAPEQVQVLATMSCVSYCDSISDANFGNISCPTAKHVCKVAYLRSLVEFFFFFFSVLHVSQFATLDDVKVGGVFLVPQS